MPLTTAPFAYRRKAISLTGAMMRISKIKCDENQSQLIKRINRIFSFLPLQTITEGKKYYRPLHSSHNANGLIAVFKPN